MEGQIYSSTNNGDILAPVIPSQHHLYDDSRPNSSAEKVSNAISSVDELITKNSLSRANRAVCQYQFKKNDIVWICRQCQKDETCVLCNACFIASDHTGHDVFFYHSQAGGCCDCGDCDAWASDGFCSKHGNNKINPLDTVPHHLHDTLTSLLGIVISEIASFGDAYANCYDIEAIIERDNSRRALQRAQFIAAQAVNSANTSTESTRDPSLSAPPDSLQATSENQNINHGNTAGESEVVDDNNTNNEHMNDDANLPPLDDVSSDSDIDEQQENEPQTARTTVTNTTRGNSAEDYVAYEEDGSFVLLHTDDVFGPEEVVNKLKTIALLSQRQSEQVYAIALREGFCVIQFDSTLGSRVRKMRALQLKTVGELRVCVVSRDIVAWEKETLKSLLWLYKVAQTSDGLCRIVCNCLSVSLVRRILEADMLVCKHLSQAAHNLFLTLMADQSFKMSLAIAYAQAYRKFSHIFGKGARPAENSIFTLSVQFLNRESFVSEIVNHHTFFESLCSALNELLSRSMLIETNWVTSSSHTGIAYVDLTHHVLVKRRYNPMIGDLKIIFTIPRMSYSFVQRCFPKFLNIVSKFQFLHCQTRRVGGQHVLYETRDWMFAFNIYLAMGSLFEPMFAWLEYPTSAGSLSDPPPLYTDIGSRTILTETSATDMKGIHVMKDVLVRIFDWQTSIAILRKKFIIPLRQLHIIGDGKYETVNLLAPLYSEPNGNYSFHIGLHRLLAYAILECVKYPHHVGTLEELKSFARQNDDASQYMNLIDWPLFCITMAAQIKQGMWRLNGHVMMDQLLNYADPPFCRLYRDSDLLLLQFFCSGDAVKGALLQILYRFYCVDWKPCPSYVLRVKFPSQAVLIEEALNFIILMVTELPRPPSDDLDTRVLPLIRRELIHRFVVGPVTHSQLPECLSLVPDSSKIKQSEIDKIVEDISELRHSSPLEPPKLILKSEAWSEYDPSFPRIGQRAHQHAIEMRPKVTVPQPMVPPLCKAHESFRNLRAGFLINSELMRLIRHLLSVYTAQRIQKNSAYAAYYHNNSDSQSNSPDDLLPCHGTTFFKVLQILTLFMHVLSTEEVGPGCHFETIQERSEARATAAFFLLHDDADWHRLEQSKTHDLDANNDAESNSTSEGDIERTKDMKMDDTQDIAGGAKLDTPNMNGDTTSNPESEKPKKVSHILSAVLDLLDSMAGAEEVTSRSWLTWFVTQAATLSPETQSFVKMKEDDKLAQERAKELEARKKRAREKAMQAMRASASTFAAHMEQMGGVSDDENMDSGADVGGEKSPTGQSTDEPLCIVCQSNTSEDICYQALCQPSKVLSSPYSTSGRKTMLRFEDSNSKCDKITEYGRPYIHLSFCGHVMHNSCFDAYFASVMHKADQNNGLIIDTDKGYYPCPFCKKLNNALVPRVCKHDLHVSDTAGSDGSRNPKEAKLAEPAALPLLDINVSHLLEWIKAPILASSTPTKSTQTDGSEVTFDQRLLNAHQYTTRFGTTSDFIRSLLQGDAASRAIRSFNSTTRESSNTPMIAGGRNGRDPSGSDDNHSFSMQTDSQNEESPLVLSTGNVDLWNIQTTTHRFLGDLCSAIMDPVDTVSEWADVDASKNRENDLLSALELSLSAVAYSVCLDEVENYPGYHLSPSLQGMGVDEQRYIGKVVDIIGECMQCFEIKSFIEESLMSAMKTMKANSGKKLQVSNVSIPSSPPSSLPSSTLSPLVPPSSQLSPRPNQQGEAQTSEIPRSSQPYPWLSEPQALLAKPIFECIVLSLALSPASRVTTQDSSVDATLAQSQRMNLESTIRWLCVAQLVSLLAGTMMSPHSPLITNPAFQDHLETQTPLVLDMKAITDQFKGAESNLKEAAGGGGGGMAPKSQFTTEWSIKGLVRDICNSIMETFSTSLADGSIPQSTPGPQLITDEALANVLERWVAFLRATAHLLSRCSYHTVSHSFPAKQNGPLSDDVLCQHIRAMGLEELMLLSGNNRQRDTSCDDETMKLPTETFGDSTAIAVLNVIKTWLADAFDNLDHIQEVAEQGMRPFPSSMQPQLISLPHTYTSFHAMLSSTCSFEFPAVCLICGSIIDAGGKGLCAIHTSSCCPDNGVFFLLQDCEILLCHGSRSSYFPSPYVDAHGERHRYFRGKPLTCDIQRYQLLRKLWATMGVSKEVYNKRSTSSRLIIFGHY